MNAKDSDELSPLPSAIPTWESNVSHNGSGVGKHLCCALALLTAGAAVDAATSEWLAARAVASRKCEVVFTLLWRGFPVAAAPVNDVAADLDEAVVAAQRAVADVLAEWPRGGLRAWRLRTHALFPAAFRADVTSALLATLGSWGADGDGEALAGSFASAGRAAPRPNPLRALHHLGLLQPLFTLLLILHKGGPPPAR